MQDFLSLPPYIWKGIFSLLKVLGAGWLLSLFAARYQKRKEIELQLKGSLLKLQLETYVKISERISQIYSSIAPPLQIEDFFKRIIDMEDWGIKSIEYSSFFSSMEKFDEYYHNLIALVHKEHIYMQYSVKQKLEEYVNFLSECKKLLDAFCDTEHSTNLKLDKNVAEEHIHAAYQLVGICVQKDMDRFYAEIDQLLAYEISHISLSYRSHYMKSAKDRFMKFISEKLEPYLEQDNLKGKLSYWFYYEVLFPSYGNAMFIAQLPSIMSYMAYLHYSHKYTPEQWFGSLPDDELEAFSVAFSSCLHHG